MMHTGGVGCNGNNGLVSSVQRIRRIESAVSSILQEIAEIRQYNVKFYNGPRDSCTRVPGTPYTIPWKTTVLWRMKGKGRAHTPAGAVLHKLSFFFRVESG